MQSDKAARASALFRWRLLLESGRFATFNELAATEKFNSSFVSRVLRLTLLAPDIVEAIVDGRQPVGMRLDQLLTPAPTLWASQRTVFRALSKGMACATTQLEECTTVV